MSLENLRSPVQLNAVSKFSFRRLAIGSGKSSRIGRPISSSTAVGVRLARPPRSNDAANACCADVYRLRRKRKESCEFFAQEKKNGLILPS